MRDEIFEYGNVTKIQWLVKKRKFDNLESFNVPANFCTKLYMIDRSVETSINKKRVRQKYSYIYCSFEEGWDGNQSLHSFTQRDRFIQITPAAIEYSSVRTRNANVCKRESQSGKNLCYFIGAAVLTEAFDVSRREARAPIDRDGYTVVVIAAR